MDTLLSWITGDLTPAARVWTALGPAVLLAGYFVVALLLYLVRYALKGPFHDPEMESRGESVLANMFFRLYFAWTIRPLWLGVYRSGIPPMAVTTLSVLLALAAGVSLAAGRLALGGWLYIFSGICDLIDGRLARARNKVTKAGGALDSILDRYADAAVLGGLAIYYRDTWVMVPTLFALVGSALVPYIRARGEAAGVSVKEVGVMQRAERILYLGVGCALSPILEALLVPEDPKPLHRIAVIGIMLLAIATQLTALHRLFFVLTALSETSGGAFLREHKKPFIRNSMSALVATVCDFTLVNVLVLVVGFAAPLATAFGCVLGGLVDFSINRVWTFHSTDRKLPQMGRYAFVSFTSALLNSGGVAVLLLLPDIDFRIAWGVVRIAVAVAWNYPLHRDYVFAPRDGAPVVKQA